MHDMELKLLPTVGEASWSLLPNLVSLLRASAEQPENIYSRVLKVTGQVWVSQKRINININHSYHQRSSPKVSFNWYMIQIQFYSTQLEKMGCHAGRCNNASTPLDVIIVTPSLEGWPTKAKEAPPHEVRLTPLYTNPVFECLGDPKP